MEVLTFPNPILRQKAQAVTQFGPELEKLGQDMLATMYASEGVGLAAPQVGLSIRFLVMDAHAGDEHRPPEPKCIANPRILQSRGEELMEEGCLSVPDIKANVKRPHWVEVEYQTPGGQTVREVMEDLAAVCVQHEMDHLDGRLFIDYLPPVKREAIKKRLLKQQKTA